MIERERLRHIPPKYHQQHSFCVWLHDRILDALRQAEAAGVATVHFDLKSEEEKKAVTAAENIIQYFIDNGREDVAKRIVINQSVIPLYADALEFILEGLFMLEKRKFTVSFALLRKPLRQSLFFLTWLFADEDEFFARMKSDPALLDRNIEPEQKKALLARAISEFEINEFLDADVIYGMVFDKKNPSGLAHYFDKALHLVTNEAAIKTEGLNLNFIFKKRSDDDLYDGIYFILAYVLLYLLLLEIETIGRMSDLPEFYLKWISIAIVGSFEAIFTEGSTMIDHVNTAWAEIFRCVSCGTPLQVTRGNAFEYFATETLPCLKCETIQQFPLYWIMSKFRDGEPTGEPAETSVAEA